MSSLNRVIRNAAVATATPAFGRQGRQFVDDWTAELVEKARSEAFEAGRKEGFAAGRSDVEGAASRLDGALHTAVRTLGQLRENAVAETLAAAIDVAEFVVGTIPEAEGAEVAERIRNAIGALDEEAMVVSVHPQDWDAVSGIVRLPNGVTMERDPSLAPGEARIAGRWATAELTREAALEVAREVLL